VKLLLDTNIIIDIITKRYGYEESLNVLKYCEAKFAEAFISAITITDVMYILRKHIPQDDLKEVIKTILTITDVAGTIKSDILEALYGNMKDYEDAVQASCANRIGADYIVTRNVKDFKESLVPVLNPKEALTFLVQEASHSINN